MRLALGRFARALLVALVLAGLALVARVHADGGLSGERLADILGPAWRSAAARAGRAAGSPQARAAAIFAAGVAAGGLSALWWAGGRLRRRPLILADLRSADMPFLHGVRHVRAYALPPVEDDLAAAGLILAEAGRGRLTLWRRASSDTLRRVPRRRLRAAAQALAASGRDHGGGVEPWRDMTLLGAEVDRLWPARGGAGAGAKRRVHRVPS